MNVSEKSKASQRKKGSNQVLQFKWQVVVLSLTLITGLYFAIKGLILLDEHYQQMTYPKSLVYGTWVESDVAPYRADRILINQYGVVISGGVIDTNFQFDGEYLIFDQGGQERRFKFHNENWAEMKQLTDKAYQPIFVKI